MSSVSCQPRSGSFIPPSTGVRSSSGTSATLRYASVVGPVPGGVSTSAGITVAGSGAAANGAPTSSVSVSTVSSSSEPFAATTLPETPALPVSPREAAASPTVAYPLQRPH